MRFLRLGLVVVVALIAACSGRVASDTTFELREFEISGPSRLDSAATRIEVTNAGEFPHTLVITDSGGHVAEATSLIQPGETVGIDLDLDGGDYLFTCRIVAQTEDGRLVDHFEEGMNATVVVEG